MAKVIIITWVVLDWDFDVPGPSLMSKRGGFCFSKIVYGGAPPDCGVNAEVCAGIGKKGCKNEGRLAPLKIPKSVR